MVKHLHNLTRENPLPQRNRELGHRPTDQPLPGNQGAGYHRRREAIPTLRAMAAIHVVEPTVVKNATVHEPTSQWFGSIPTKS